MKTISRRSLLSGAAILLGSAICLSAPNLGAQKGYYTKFGSGCGQIVPLSSSTANMTCSSPTYQRGSGNTRYAIHCKEKVARTILGASFRMAAYRAGSMYMELWLANSLGYPTSRLRTGKVPVKNWYGQYSGKFNASYKMPAGRDYAIVIYGNSDLYLPICKSGTAVKGTIKTAILPWFPFSARWSFRVDCGYTTKSPVLGATNEPAIGRPMTILLASARPNSIALLNFGDSNTRWGALNLPLSMSAFRAPNCYLRTSQLFSVVVPTNSAGQSFVQLRVPNKPSLVGTRFYNQAMVYDPAANKLRLSFTNGAAAQVGKPCTPINGSARGATLRFTLPRVNFFGFPGLTISGGYTGKESRTCCSLTGPQASYYYGKGTLSGQVGQFSIPITALGKALDDINAKICSTLDSATAGQVKCSTLMGISVNGIKVNADLNVLRNDCKNINGYTSKGTVAFPGGIFTGVDTSASINIPIFGKRSWKFKLGATAVPHGTWSISNNGATMTIKITSVTVTGSTTIPYYNKKVSFNKKINTPSLTFTTPVVKLPKITFGI